MVIAWHVTHYVLSSALANITTTICFPPTCTEGYLGRCGDIHVVPAGEAGVPFSPASTENFVGPDRCTTCGQGIGRKLLQPGCSNSAVLYNGKSDMANYIGIIGRFLVTPPAASRHSTRETEDAFKRIMYDANLLTTEFNSGSFYTFTVADNVIKEVSHLLPMLVVAVFAQWGLRGTPMCPIGTALCCAASCPKDQLFPNNFAPQTPQCGLRGALSVATVTIPSMPFLTH